MAHLLWQGPSMLDGAPIVLLATDASTNKKLGNGVLTTYILRADIHPQEAVTTGGDSSICGDCKYRGDKGKGRTCYVALRRGPFSVWNQFHKGEAGSQALFKAGKGKVVRLGSYGDPAAVEFEVWRELLRGSVGRMGYTHQWKTCDQRFKDILMASVDDPREYELAKSMGWKCYRVRLPEEPRMKGERPCPASDEAGKKVTCSDCRGCNGQRHDFTIVAHGQDYQKKAYRQFRLSQSQ